MKRLDYYVITTVALTMLMASMGLLGILTIFTVLEQIEDMENNYDITAVLTFSLYSMPRMFYEIIPYSALIGCLAGLGILANNSELIVMRAAGVSTWAIARSAMKPALVLVFLGLYLGEYMLPELEKTARLERELALSDSSKVKRSKGFWYREGEVYMHFDEITRSGLVTGVRHYYYDENHKLQRSLYAERGVFHDVREDETYWLLEKVTITDILPDRTTVKKLPSFTWQTELKPDLLATESLVQPDRMSIGELNVKIEYMQAQGLNSAKFELGFWRKVLQPLATVALVFVAISFIFGPLREATMGMRVISGLVIGILFKFIQDLLSPASMVYGFEPIVAILLPIVVCFAAGYVLLRRAG